jgi:hypothetical protein
MSNPRDGQFAHQSSLSITDQIDGDLRHKWVFLFIEPLMLTIEGLMLSDGLRLNVVKDEESDESN